MVLFWLLGAVEHRLRWQRPLLFADYVAIDRLCKMQSGAKLSEIFPR